jgi:hypothetical protein
VVSLSASALDFAAPFEQLNIDRALPQIEFAPVQAYVADSRAPFEQLAIDRTLPNLPAKNVQYAETAGAGGTRSDASSEAAGSPWAHDYNFIAPAQ